MERSLVIIGGGPAGLAAAIEAKKNGIDDILIIERDKSLGGILLQCIHNGFGLHTFGEQLTGPEYAYRFIEEVENLKIDYMNETMVLNISKDRVITAISPEKGIFNINAKAIILSMGCRERTRGALLIPGTRPAGILTAGSAQRFVNIEGYNIGKKVVILGSGDIGLIMARRLTLEGAEVKMVLEIMPYSTGLKRNIAQCLEDFNIPLLLNHTVVKIHGDERLNGVTIAKVDKDKNIINGSEKFVECDTLLLSVGLIPENDIIRGNEILMDPVTGGPIVNELRETSIDGIFACGNCVHVHDLVDFVTEESRLAGLGASMYLKNLLKKGEIIYSKAGFGIRYVVPQRVNTLNLKGPVKFFMRTDNIYKNVYLTVLNNGNVIKKIKKVIAAPGEMEHIIIEEKLLKDIGGGSLSFTLEDDNK